MPDTDTLALSARHVLGAGLCGATFFDSTFDRVHRLGFLGQTSAAAFARQTDALRQGLRSLGYEDGRNLAIEYRWAEGKLDRLPALARELVERRVDVIVRLSRLPE